MPDFEYAKKWIEYAKTDYAIALHDTAFYPTPIEIVCYHCQQAAEKALKSILAYHEQSIPKTHDLSRLWALCEPLEPQLQNLEKEAVELSDFAVTPRYPDATELEEVDMLNALEYAKTIVEAVSLLWEQGQSVEE
jgi:HEPN domain-containing protein